MQLRKICIITILGIAVTAALFLFVRTSYAQPALVVHAGAGIRPPLDELGKAFEKKTGVRVDYNYKGSGCLLADICFSKTGDAYIPGELFYIEQAHKRGFIAKSRTVAQMAAVVIVQKGNPKDIRSIKDLTRPNLRVGLGDAEAVAVGRAANECLVKAGILKQVEENVVMSALNVVELGIGVKLKHLDAAIVWDATAHLFEDDVERIDVPDKWRVDCPVPVGILTFSAQPEVAERYMDFLASKDAAKVFAKHGYGVAEKTASEEKKS